MHQSTYTHRHFRYSLRLVYYICAFQKHVASNSVAVPLVMFMQYAVVCMLAITAFFHDGPNTNTTYTSNPSLIAENSYQSAAAKNSHQSTAAKNSHQSLIAEFQNQLLIAEFRNQSLAECPNQSEFRNQSEYQKPNQRAIAVQSNQKPTDSEKSGQNMQKINNADMTSRNPAYDKHKLVVIIGLVLLCLMAILVVSHVFSDFLNIIELQIVLTFIPCLVFTVYYITRMWNVKSINFCNVCGGIVFVILGVIGIYQFLKTADIKTAGGIPPARKGRE